MHLNGDSVIEFLTGSVPIVIKNHFAFKLHGRRSNEIRLHLSILCSIRLRIVLTYLFVYKRVKGKYMYVRRRRFLYVTELIHHATRRKKRIHRDPDYVYILNC